MLRFYTTVELSLASGWMSNYADTVNLSYSWLLGWLLGMLLMYYGVVAAWKTCEETQS